jgi:hypothetical protein
MRLTRTLRGELDNKDAENAEREQAEKLAAFTVSISANFPVAPSRSIPIRSSATSARQVAEFIAKDANF